MQMYEALRGYNLPDEHGHFGKYGGVFVAETLVHALDELRELAIGWLRAGRRRS